MGRSDRLCLPTMSIVTDKTSLWPWLGSRLRCAIMNPMTEQHWPDHLIRPTQEERRPASARLLAGAGHLARLAEARRTPASGSLHGSAAPQRVGDDAGPQRHCVPPGTTHLNTYLGASQRAALEKTLLMPSVAAESWIGQAVALVVIYRWYAPQLVAAFSLLYDDRLEAETLSHLHAKLPDWPSAITTD